MRKYTAAIILIVISVGLISWGGVGHKTVATIAYNHLTPKAKDAVKALLGDTTMADVASWADEIRMKPQYKYTTPLHYVDLPLGLSYSTFRDTVTGQPADNVYKAVMQCEKDLSSTTTNNEQKSVALKYLIHFIGDLHKPMHVSRAEDQGGNTIQVQYLGKGSNLHSVWDSKLIGTEGKSFEQMSDDYDTATEKQIKEWQSEPLLKWLWESYQITTKLYSEVEQNNKLDEAYYKAHINIVHERVEMAGIRLAGVLNSIFEHQNIVATSVTRTPPTVKQMSNEAGFAGVKLEEVSQHIGERVAVQGVVADYKKFEDMVLVNLGAPYPNNPLTLVFKGDAVALSNRVIASKGKKILVIGTIVDYKGKPQIEVRIANQVLEAPQ
ncbi:MAG: S1/P1 nuclease [Mucilaginibacter sp.]|nr:S1/P1 nuclease [Mucilaginibacter sp.]